MKNFIIILFLAVAVVGAFLFVLDRERKLDTIAVAKIQKGEIMNKKVLVAYFSWGGNTKSIAEKIQAQTDGDIFRIETVKPYPTDYNQTTVVAKQEKEQKIYPELKDNGNIENYDVIFVGTPAWWYTMAPAVMTFLKNNNFEGKTIVPFITHGGGGKYHIAEDMLQYAKGAKLLNNPFVVYENGDANTDTDIKNWLEDIQK